MEITAWYDDDKRSKALGSLNEIYYYMVHSTHVEERRNWAVAYTELLLSEQAIDTELHPIDK